MKLWSCIWFLDASENVCFHYVSHWFSTCTKILAFVLLWSLWTAKSSCQTFSSSLAKKNLWASKTHWRFGGNAQVHSRETRRSVTEKKKPSVWDRGFTRWNPGFHTSFCLAKGRAMTMKSDPSPRMPVESQGEPESPKKSIVYKYIFIYLLHTKNDSPPRKVTVTEMGTTRELFLDGFMFDLPYQQWIMYIYIYNIYIYIQYIYVYIYVYTHKLFQVGFILNCKMPGPICFFKKNVGQWDLPQSIKLEGTPPGSR